MWPKNTRKMKWSTWVCKPANSLKKTLQQTIPSREKTITKKHEENKWNFTRTLYNNVTYGVLYQEKIQPSARLWYKWLTSLPKVDKKVKWSTQKHTPVNNQQQLWEKNISTGQYTNRKPFAITYLQSRQEQQTREHTCQKWK